MKNAWLGALIVILMFASMMLSAAKSDAFEAKLPRPMYTPHAPCRINSDADFLTSTCVTGGNGTQNDPYVIEGWNISGYKFGYALYMGNTSAHVTVKNNELYNADLNNGFFDSGLVLGNVKNAIIENNTIRNNRVSGIRSSHSNEISITRNRIYGNQWYGITLDSSMNNKLEDNVLSYNGIRILGNLTEWTSHNISTNNLVNGKPIYYYKNQTGIIVPPNAGQVILANCTKFIIRNLVLDTTSLGIQLGYSYRNEIRSNSMSYNSYSGVDLEFSDNNTISDNNAFNNYNNIHLYRSNRNTIENNIVGHAICDGISLWGSRNNSIIRNNAFNNDVTGIHLESENNTVANNTISSNPFYGISIWGGKNNLIENNHVNGSLFGIFSRGHNNLSKNEAYGNEIGIDSDSNGLVIFRNNVHHNSDGIQISGGQNNIILNTISENTGCGLCFSHSDKNSIVRNDIFNNSKDGISFISSTENNVTGNKIHENSGNGIQINSSRGNIIDDNEISDNHDGIGIWKTKSTTIAHNNITSNVNSGINITNSSVGNLIHHNFFIDNNNKSKQAYDDTRNNTNYWNGTGEGNRWSDFDEPSEGCIDIEQNGVCDAPYPISGGKNAEDYYPLTTFTVTSPSIVDTVPEDKATNVTLDAKIVIIFDRAMNRSATENAISAIPAIEWAQTWSSNGTTVTFNPSSNLLSNTNYTVLISTSAKDMYSINMKSPYIFTFITIDKIENIDSYYILISATVLLIVCAIVLIILLIRRRRRRYTFSRQKEEGSGKQDSK